MHELGIVFHIIKTVEEVALKNNVKQIKSVTLELGEVSAVIDTYLLDCWKWAVEKHEITKGCKLKIEVIKALTICEDCSKTYSTIEHGKICPFCKSEHTHLLVGNEVNIKEIEVV